MPPIPEVTLRLEPSGQLSLGLPGTGGTQRRIPLKPGKLEQVLEQVLFALALGEAQIGQDGAPTKAQADCWQNHSIWPSANCPFCRASGRFSYQGRHQGREATTRVLSERKLGDSGVVVRRIRPGMTKGQQEAQASRSRVQQQAQERLQRSRPEEIGL